MRLGLIFFCRKIIISNRNLFKLRGPLLLACNHPNSFFDAVLLGALFKHPVHFLARGDAFKNPLAKKFLKSLKAIPIYRLSEGKEYLALNDTTFEQCNEVLLQGGIVLIFSEGLCVNQWKLRPFKKGTARIAINAWRQDSISNSFRVLPVGLNYNSFTRFGKNIIIDFGEPISKKDIGNMINDGEQINHFNKVLYARLEKSVLTNDKSTSVVRFVLGNPALIRNTHQPISVLKGIQQKLTSFNLKKTFENLYGTKATSLSKTAFTSNLLVSVLLFIPALFGFIIHAPVYLPLKVLIKNKTKGTVFYDSTLFIVLLIIYPLYLLLITLLTAITLYSLYVLLLIATPLLGLVFLYWYKCLTSVVNYYKLPNRVLESLSHKT